MTAAFTIKEASVPFKMANEVVAFHQTATSTDNVSQMALLGASFSACSR